MIFENSYYPCLIIQSLLQARLKSLYFNLFPEKVNSFYAYIIRLPMDGVFSSIVDSQ